MKNKVIYFFGFIIFIIFFIIIKLVSNEKNINDNLDKNILKTLQSDISFYNKLRGLTSKSDVLFFLYSEDECNTCIESAFLDVFELINNKAEGKQLIRVVVITPEKLSDKEIRSLSIRYDGKIKFITGKDYIWENNSLFNKEDLAFFFKLTTNDEIKNSYVYKLRNTKLNEQYFKKLEIN